MKNLYLIFTLLSFFGKASCLFINAQGPSSLFVVRGSSKLNVNNVLTAGFNIRKESSAVLTGNTTSSKIVFSDGVLDVDEALNSSSYVFSTTPAFTLDGSKVHKAIDNSTILNLTVSGTGNKLYGAPIFSGNIVIGSGADIALGIRSKMNVNVALGSGTMKLENDLLFTDTKQMTGTGTMNLQNYKLKFGAKPLTFSSAITWQNASDIDLGGLTTLSATWTFVSDGVINGNGNVLNISSAGVLAIAASTTLSLTDLYLKGLGSTGDITFANATTSILRLSNVVIEMTGSKTISSGQVIIDGPVTIITKSNTLTFSSSGVLTINGQTLQFDRLGSLSGGVSPTTAGANLVLNNSARIVESNTIESVPGGFTISSNTTLPYDLYLSEDHVLSVNASCTITGNGHRIIFANKKSANMILSNSVALVFNSVNLQNFASEHVTLGSGASIVFDQNCQVETYPDTTLTSNLNFGPNSILWGRGNSLSLGSANIISKSATGLTIKDVVLKGLSTNNLKCEIATAKITLDNAQLYLDANFGFTIGVFAIRNQSSIKGPYQFTYQSSQISSIETKSELTIFDGSIFRYQPTVASNNLLSFADSTAQLTLQNCTLSVSTTGLLLTTGSLKIAGSCSLASDATVPSEGVFIGNNTLANDLSISIEPGASLDLTQGYLTYNNVEI